MRYGGPTIASALAKLSNPVVLPLYPQYSASTTSSVLDLLPSSVRVVREFHDHPAYIRALATNVDGHWAEHGRGERLVMSFHGLPQRAVDRGDPYQKQDRKSTRLNSSHLVISYAVFCLKKKIKTREQ